MDITPKAAEKTGIAAPHTLAAEAGAGVAGAKDGVFTSMTGSWSCSFAVGFDGLKVRTEGAAEGPSES